MLFIFKILYGGSISGLHGKSLAGKIDDKITLILLATAISDIDIMLSVIDLTVDGPVFSAISFIPAKITTMSGLRSTTSCLKRTSICGVVWPLIPLLI